MREVPGAGGERDAISPYGYPGLTLRGGGDDDRRSGGGHRGGAVEEGGEAPAAEAPIDPAAIDFGPTGLVSVFLRHTLGEPPLAGTSERSVVLLADPALPPKRRSSDRHRINRNRRAGYETSIVPGAEASAAEVAGFLTAYEQTMRRTGAAQRYFFGGAYFERVLASPRALLALVRAPGGEIVAGSVAVRSDGFLHYHLSGTADAHLSDSPMKNVVATLADHAAELGLPLNLGGGMARGDRLEEFKRGFANRELPWRTSEIVCDPEAYARLSADRPDTGFFPRYRAG